MTGKYVIVQENVKNFETDNFNDDKINKNSKFEWFPLTTQQRTNVVKMVTRSELKLYDYQVSIFDFFVDKDITFKAETTESRLNSYQQHMWMVITYEMSLTRIEYIR